MPPGYYAQGPSDFLPPPYDFFGLYTITLTVTGDKELMQAVCDSFLNEPLGVDRFEPSDDRVKLSFSRFPRSESRPAAAFGVTSYQEVSILFELWDVTTNSLGGFFSPILLLDGPQAGLAEYYASAPINAGRELFGLPKARGEITFDPINLSGRADFFSAGGSGNVIPVSPFVRFGRHFLGAKIKRGAYHPLEIVDRMWGLEVAQRVYRGLRGSEEEFPPVVEQALLYLRDNPLHNLSANDLALINDRLELEEATKVAEETGLLSALGMTTQTLDLSLLGLRQLHNVADHSLAAHSQVIKSVFTTDYGMQPNFANFTAYDVTVYPSAVKDALGLKSSYTVGGSDILFFNGVDAIYGETGTTSVVGP